MATINQAEGARRWRPFMDTLVAVLPEIEGSLEDTFGDDDSAAFTTGDGWTQIVAELLGRDYYPKH